MSWYVFEPIMPTSEELLEAYSTIRRLISCKATGLLKEIGLGTRQFIILRALSERGDSNVTELAELCSTDIGTASRSIEQLRKCGLLTKVQSSYDARAWTIRLTSKGRSKIPKITQIYSELSRLAFGHLSTGDRMQLSSLLKSLIEKLEQR
jgi:DNA-binding MarR family transcriptional regulator